MRALKAIVIGMGVMIVAAIVLIAYGLYKKSVEPGWTLFGNRAATTSRLDVTSEPFANIALDLKPGCRIVDVRPDGGRAYIVVGPDESCAEVVVVDVVGGRILGRISGR